MVININEFSSGIGVAIVFALAGLGLFLVAIKLMSNSIKNMSSGFISKMIKTITKNKYRGFMIGILFTTMIQSSDGSVALVIALISAGMLKFKKAIPFILGANIGTATTALIVAAGSASAGAFEFVQYFPLLVFVGAGMITFIKEPKKFQVAMLIFSVGAIFLGLKVMGAGMKAIANQGWFQSFVGGVGTNPWVALISNTALTGAVQSSSATVTVVQGIYSTHVDAANHVLAPEMGLGSAIAMVIGANIGTTFTALIASFGGNKDARKVAVIWLTTNLIMAIIIMPIIKYYAMFIEIIQPIHIPGDPITNNDDLLKTVTDINFKLKLQLAWAHMLFNIVMAFSFFWLVNQLDWWANKVIRKKNVHHSYDLNLSSDLLGQDPILAFQSTKKASQVMGDMTLDSIALLKKYIKDPRKETYKKYIELMTLIEISRKSLSNYLVQIGAHDLPRNISNQHMAMILSVRSLERVPILGQRFLDALRDTLKKGSFNVHPSIIKESDYLLNIVNSITKRGIKQLVRYSSKRKEEVRALSDKLNRTVEEFSTNHVIRRTECEFDYLAEIKLLERMGHHGIRLQKYTRTGNKDIEVIVLDKKLEKELSIDA